MRGSPHNSLRACGAPFGQTRRVSSRSMRAPTRMPPRKHPAAGAASKGLNTRRPRGRKRLALARQAERSDGPCGCWAPPPFLVAPAARRGWRIRARDCLSAAGASSSETPPAPSTAGCGLLGSDTHFTAVRSTAPSGRAEGSVNWGSDPNNPSQTVGSPFLW